MVPRCKPSAVFPGSISTAKGTAAPAEGAPELTEIAPKKREITNHEKNGLFNAFWIIISLSFLWSAFLKPAPISLKTSSSPDRKMKTHLHNAKRGRLLFADFFTPWKSNSAPCLRQACYPSSRSSLGTRIFAASDGSEFAFFKAFNFYCLETGWPPPASKQFRLLICKEKCAGKKRN